MTRSPNITRYRYCESVAKDIANMYLQKVGGVGELPVPVERIAFELCHLRINIADLSSFGKDINGTILPFEGKIVVDGHANPTRNRFTISHEIAHWAIEKIRGQQEETVFYDIEELADRIAGALLMPEEALCKYAKEEKNIDKEIAEKWANIFNVSNYAMCVRIVYLYENTRRFQNKIDWISLNSLKDDLVRIKEEILEDKKSSKKKKRNYSTVITNFKPVVEKLDNYPDVVTVVVDAMAQKGIGLSFRSDTKEKINVSVVPPAEKLERPFFIELAGPPNAGKDTQSRILQEYFRNIRRYRITEIQETYSRCVIEGLDHYQKYLWSLLETIQALLYDRPPRFDVVIINRGIFDLMAMMEFHFKQKHCNAKEKETIINFLMLPTWRAIIDVVFMMPIDPQHSIQREEEEQRKTVAALAHSFDPLSIPKPRQKIVNEQTLSQLSTSYEIAYQKYGKYFNRIHILKENGSLSVEETARGLIEQIHDKMPQPKDQLLKESSVSKAVKIAREKRETVQLPLF